MRSLGSALASLVAAVGADGTPVFIGYTCARCGHTIDSAEEAHDHRALNRLGPNKCRKMFAGLGSTRKRPSKASKAEAKRRSRRNGRDRVYWETPPIDRRAWHREVGMAVVGHKATGEPRLAKVWAVERAPWAVTP